MIHTIIFDIGKVLVDYDSEAYLKSYGFDPEEEKIIRHAVFGGSVWHDLDRGAKPIPQICRELAALVPEKYREDALHVFLHYGPVITRVDYAQPWLRSLKARGYRVYYLSNYSKWMIDQNEEALDFLPLMDGGLFSYEVHQIKPEPEIYLSLFHRYPEIVREEAVFLDDVPENVEAACRYGLKGIVFHTKEQAEADLEKLLTGETMTGIEHGNKTA